MLEWRDAGDDDTGMRRRALFLFLLCAGSWLGAAGAAAAADCSSVAVVSYCLPSSAPAQQPAPEPEPAPAPTAPPAAAPSGAITDEPAAASRMLDLVNGARSSAGLRPLESRGPIVAIAGAHSRRMAERGDIFHNPAYFSAATRQALGARGLGENVAMNSSLEDAHRRLLASPGHRANILNPSFDAVGIVVVQRSGMLFLTQNFVASAGTPAAAAAPRSPAPVPTAARPTRPVAAAAPTAPAEAPVPTPAPPAPAEVAEPPAEEDKGGARSSGHLALTAISGLLAGAVGVGSWLVRNSFWA